MQVIKKIYDLITPGRTSRSGMGHEDTTNFAYGVSASRGDAKHQRPVPLRFARQGSSF
jgi:hypothetical protein